MATDKYLNLQGLEEVASKVNQKLKTVLTMPATPDEGTIVMYKGATTSDYIQGCVYMYEQIGTYFKWSDGSVDYYTKAEAPEIGDTVYSDTSGTDSGYTIDSYDDVNDEVTINSAVYSRDNTGDVDILDWVLKDTSIILNDENKTGNEAKFYAPTTPGTKNQVVVSNGEGAPTWASFAGYSPSVIDDKLVFVYGVLPEVEGSSLVLEL